MSSYQQFAELTMTDTEAGRGFSNPSYDVSHQETEKPNEEIRNGQQNGKQLSRSNSIGADPDHIEVSLEEGSKNPAEDVLQRAAGFFVDNNENYNISWDEASHMISDSQTDPSRPPTKGFNKEYVRWRTRRIIESIYFRASTLILIMIDLIVVTIDLALGPGAHEGLKVIDFVFSLYFVFEVIVRILVLTPSTFFLHIYNTLDFIIVFCTFIISCVALDGDGWVEGLALFTALRFLRIVRIFKIWSEKQHLQTGVRQLISQNKRRYQQDGFDLDLTYVTSRVIATSFPSSGIWSLYRNPIEKVAAFLDSKHKDKYKIYNLCSERTYDVVHFHNRVERVMIDDHNVPSVKQMLEFANNVRDWLGQHPDNVIVVHCKGGKGRTGTMICVWLIESGVFSSAANSLDYFGNRRTDTNVSTKFQGVETPSQSRYVGYYEWVKNNDRQLPLEVPLTLTEIKIRGMMYMGRGDGSDFWMEVDLGRGNTVFNCHFGNQINCQSSYDSSSDLLTITTVNSPVLKGDVRILFQTSASDVPKNYEKCPFYFWFHTGFIKDGKLLLTRDQLDNPHKSKTWFCFKESLTVELSFKYLQE